ncbi:hypothetical protein ACKC9G_03720 [Pokkaliibacter sp. CJK22405]|uniref:hypothetical protein n=1 Tax=Pokkaliibacter sp. CJK22405 TaxID=3384615 RepID=UPI003984B751
MTSGNLPPLQRMQSQLEAFTQGQLVLSDLIADLAFLGDALPEVSSCWLTKFDAALLDLESIDAYQHDFPNDTLSPQLNAVVTHAITTLRQLVSETLGNHLAP